MERESEDCLTELEIDGPDCQVVWQRPIIQYIEEPSISALRVRAEKEEEMKTLDDYWKDRIQKQEVCSCCDICYLNF